MSRISSEFIWCGRAGSKRFPLACVTLGRRAGSEGRIWSQRPALPGFAMAVGSVGHVPHCPPVMGTLGPVPKENPGPVALEYVGSGQAQLLVGLARVQCWDRSSSPSGAGTCARTDPARSGAGTCDFGIDLSQLAALGTQQFQSP